VRIVSCYCLKIITLIVCTLTLSACQLCDLLKIKPLDAIRWSKTQPQVSDETQAQVPCEGQTSFSTEQQPSCYDLAVTEVDRLFCQAETGDVLAMEEIADRYHAGKGLPRVFSDAVRFYKKAAKSGSPYAQFMLSIMYAEGRGVKPDLAESVKWFKRGNKHAGANLAKFRVAKRYVRGYGFKQDDEKAVYWYALAANDGFAPAQIEMGDAFYEGRGRPQDDEQAFDWYLRAAEQNHAYAQSMVGLMLLEGKGVEQNYPDAVMWTQKAAYQGARQAQYRLGRLYFYGNAGVRQSDAKAYAWWKLALKDVDDEEPPELQVVIERMDPETRDQAVKLAKEYSAKYEKPGSLSKI